MELGASQREDPIALGLQIARTGGCGVEPLSYLPNGPEPRVAIGMAPVAWHIARDLPQKRGKSCKFMEPRHCFEERVSANAPLGQAGCLCLARLTHLRLQHAWYLQRLFFLGEIIVGPGLTGALFSANFNVA